MCVDIYKIQFLGLRMIEVTEFVGIALQLLKQKIFD